MKILLAFSEKILESFFCEVLSLSNAVDENCRGANKTTLLTLYKGTDSLSSIPKWMTLFPRRFPACSMLTCVTVFLLLRRLKIYPRSTMGQSRVISLVFICVERARLWQKSHFKQYGQSNRTFGQRHGRNNYFFFSSVRNYRSNKLF